MLGKPGSSWRFWEWLAAFGLTPSAPQEKPPSRHDLFATCSRLTAESVHRVLRALKLMRNPPAVFTQHKPPTTPLSISTFQYLNHTHPLKVTPHPLKLSLTRTGILNQLLLLRYSRNTSFRPLKWHEGDGLLIHMLMSWHRYYEPNQHGVPSQDLHCKKCPNQQVISVLTPLKSNQMK